MDAGNPARPWSRARGRGARSTRAQPLQTPHSKRPLHDVADTKIAFGVRQPGDSYRYDYDYDLYGINADGSNMARLTDGASPAWSPDVRRFAYTRHVEEPNPALSSTPASASPTPLVDTPYIFTINADGSGRKKLQDKAAVEPAWSPDGKQIAFTLYTPQKRYKDIGYPYCGIYIMDAEGSGEPRKLATGPGCASSPAWSPDGKKIAYTNGLGVDKGGGSSMSDISRRRPR